MCGRSSAAAAALLTLVLKDRKVTQNTQCILVHYPSVSSLLQSQFHIQFFHCPATPIPLRPPATVGSLDSPVCVYILYVCVLLLIFAVPLWLWAPAVITAV